jgi:hypothetical protein
MINNGKNLKSELFNSSVNAMIINYIKQIVCAYYEIDNEVYASKSRDLDTLRAKHTAVYMIKKNTKLKIKEIGNIFGYDHATVIHVEKKYNNYMGYDRNFKKDIDELQSIIENKRLEIHNKIDPNDDQSYYYIDMDNFKSVKLSGNRAIIFVNFDDTDMENTQVKDVETDIFLYNKAKKYESHEKKGMFVLERKKLSNG